MTTEEFWCQLGTYNAATWPVQVAWTAAVIIMICLAFAKRTACASITMKVLLSFAFAWNGAVYFLVFSDGPVYDFFFAPLFFIVSILFIVDIFVKRTEFTLPERGWNRYATLFWILLWLVYPLIGLALGRGFPKVCTPMNPCPSTVLAIGLTAAALPRGRPEIIHKPAAVGPDGSPEVPGGVPVLRRLHSFCSRRVRAPDSDCRLASNRSRDRMTKKLGQCTNFSELFLTLTFEESPFF
jgi:hypothetical protein